jgi:hypothetical protein
MFCPECGGELSYRDCRYRISKDYSGEKKWLVIRRLKCSSCNRLHNELPDYLTPYKHYKTEVIENVLDGVSTPYDESTEDYPCESTMKRWNIWLEYNRFKIEGVMRGRSYAIRGCARELFDTSISWLKDLKKHGTGWLGIVTGLIYNSNHRMT